MSNVVGIDLGTTFSTVAHLDHSGRPVIILNADESNITPSCVYFEGGRAEVGEEARKAVGQDDPNAVGRFKREMGSDKTYPVGEDELTPVHLSALVIGKLIKDAASKIGEISDAVITVPANFGHRQRSATKKAAEEAGIRVEHMIDEPTAAALYYAYKEKNIGGIYAVYDLGGGTFDISIIEISGQKVSVLASQGSDMLGGIDFDVALQQLVFEKYKEEKGETLQNHDWDLADVAKLKHSLSKRESASVRINRVTIPVTRAEFEEAISLFIEEIEMNCETALLEAKLKSSEIAGLFLAGGSTRIPIVADTASRAFGGVKPISSANVDEVVALGAALYAAYKGDPSQLNPLQQASINEIEFNEITHKFFGTLVVNTDAKSAADAIVNNNLLSRGQKRPCSVTKTFYTMHDGQTVVECSVTESGVPMTSPDFVETIWEGKLDLPPNRPANQEVEVTYSFDGSQMMHCVFKDVATGRTKEVDLDTNDEQTQAGEPSPLNKFEVE